MDKLEKEFYELYGIEPDRMTMAVFVKSVEDEVTPENYEEKKKVVLENFINTPFIDLTKNVISNTWSSLKEKTNSAYCDYVKEMSVNN